MLASNDLPQMNMFQKVSALAPLLVLGVTALLTYVREHTRKERVVSALEIANKRVAFWNAWADTHAKLNPGVDAEEIKIRALREIAVAAQDAEEIFKLAAHHERAEARAKASRSWWRSVLLLYKPERPVGWVYRVFYWNWLLIFLAFFVSFAHDVSMHKLNFGAGVVAMLMVGAPLYIPYFLAKHYDPKKELAGSPVNGSAGLETPLTRDSVTG